MATKKASSAAPAAAPTFTSQTLTRNQKPTGTRVPSIPTRLRKLTPQRPIAAVFTPTKSSPDAAVVEPLLAALPHEQVFDGLLDEEDEYAIAKLDPEEVERLMSNRCYLGMRRELQEQSRNASRRDRETLAASHALRLIRAGYRAAKPNDLEDNSPDFFSLGNLNVTEPVLQSPHNNPIMTIVLAFCSYELLPFGKHPDVYPMPHQSNRAGTKLIFNVGTNELTAPTITGYTFEKDDWLEVDPSGRLDPRHGDLVVAVHGQDLTVMEVRSRDKEAKDGGPLHLYELRNGNEVLRSDALVVGLIENQRRRVTPLRGLLLELDKDLSEERARRALVKGGGW